MIDFILITLCVLYVWLGITVLVPRMLRSISRHRIWQLRDEIADAVITKKLAHSDAAKELITRIETVIRHADSLSLWTLMFIPKSDEGSREEYSSSIKNIRAKLSREELEQIDAYEKRFSRLVAIHFLTTSVLGWVVCAIGLTIGVAIVGYQRVTDHVTDWVCKHTESQLDAALVRLGDRSNSVSLASCV